METGDAPHCLYYVKKRRRFCKFELVKDQQYCATHSPITTRIPCPLDGRHTAYIGPDKWRHLKKCPQAKVVAQECLQPFYNEGVNALEAAEVCKSHTCESHRGDDTPDETATKEDLENAAIRALVPPFYQMEDVNLREKKTERFTHIMFPTTDTVTQWRQQVDTAYEAMCAEVAGDVDPQIKAALKAMETGHVEPTRFDEALKLPETNEMKRQLLPIVCNVCLNKRRVELDMETIKDCMSKHEIQEANIWLYVMENLKPSSDTVFMELGAGKGGLTRWFVQSQQDALFLLVDREARQHKREAQSNGFVDKDLEARCVRLRLDCANFDCVRLTQFLHTSDPETRRSLLKNPYPTGRPWILKLLTLGREPPPTSDPGVIRAELEIVRANHQDNSDTLKARLMDTPERTSHTPFIFLAKHLCGGASDIALDILHKTAAHHPAVSAALAPCCFHACEETGVRGITHMHTWFGGKLDYRYVRASVGWRTGAQDVKAAIGTKLHVMLMMCRVLWLVERGFSVECVCYIGKAVSLENILLLIKNKNL
eukprot:Blabericola_migrator_1__5507@NODE_280_length_10436_cov_136_209085_g230_i0_p4_GENE_NODE_280_length_10436_cov_136_209085_g230_i0NODE_280_length_10436_cov_136_209085_g230_i0_p4_ORF_typecomplete_len540_score136_44TRM13/PF05206_14/6_7e34Methyltransf_32/PF13679_6/5_3e03Methyltransf_32/PF13679_6/1_6e08zfTRM13_CCCH/PF11722_8/5_1e08zfU1148K/PF05253_12/0_028Methyltransf_25/PF13649_6/0_15Methyltransf_11/PF08241_12/0_11_NODE_280_length_10436_cov_136_209085_g230_i0101629